MPNLIYLGNYASTDSYEGDYTSEYANSLIGASAGTDTLNVTWVNYVDQYGDGAINDDESGQGDYIGYDAGNGNGYIRNATDSTMSGNVTLTLSDGSTQTVEVVLIQQVNGDLFMGDLLNNGTLDGLSISNVEIVSITENCYTGWYTNQSADNTVIAPLTNTLDGYVEGTSGNDIIDGNYTGDPDGDCIDANDQILAGEGVNDDIVYAGAGDDLVLAGDGDDDVYGGTGNDTLCGQDGDDILRGEGGNDLLEGMNGNDLMYGGS